MLRLLQVFLIGLCALAFGQILRAEGEDEAAAPTNIPIPKSEVEEAALGAAENNSRPINAEGFKSEEQAAKEDAKHERTAGDEIAGNRVFDDKKKLSGDLTFNDPTKANRVGPQDGEIKPYAGPEESLTRFLIGFGIIVLAIIVGIWLLKRSPKIRGYFAGGPVKVLSRNFIGPRSALFVLKVGDRVLIVGQSAEGLRTLSEITEPGEVSRLLAHYAENAPDSMTRTFRDVMGEAAKAPGQVAKNRKEPVANSDTHPASAPVVGGDPGEGPMTVDPGYASQLKLQALRAKMEKTKASIE